jgi:hypothetical protein
MVVGNSDNSSHRKSSSEDGEQMVDAVPPPPRPRTVTQQWMGPEENKEATVRPGRPRGRVTRSRGH